MPVDQVIMDVKESADWHALWWQHFHGSLPLNKLPPAPQGRDLKKGTLTGSVNYKAHTLVNAVLDPRLRSSASIAELAQFYKRQRDRGHMDTEELTPSHSFHHYAPMSLALFYFFNTPAKGGLYGEALDWWQREIWLIRRFSTPIGVVAPGARGIRRGENVLAGRSPHRDQIMVYANTGKMESLPKDRGRHGATIMWSALRQAGFDQALAPPSSKVKLMFPVSKATRSDGSFTAWLPVEALGGLEKPQMVATWDGATDHYSREPVDGIPSGELEVIGGC